MSALQLPEGLFNFLEFPVSKLDSLKVVRLDLPELAIVIVTLVAEMRDVPVLALDGGHTQF